ncbi:winged helix-turn-helix transcriptional regulator [Flavobacterium ovatum]|uniref:winged helix-turn-helix transcriptional regulator n=1 Tax=Flavobacterium ovatum TaxID=1928857 RepID=UPI00344F5F94
MTTFDQFNKELTKLENFYKSSLYAYEQTDFLLYHWRKNQEKLKEINFEVVKPTFYKIKTKGTVSDNQKNLAEIIFVRCVSALEVYLTEQVREVFFITKEPFKKEHIMVEIKQSELLSAKSTTDIFNKIINKELRRLSSGGFGEIIKYYKKTLLIDISEIKPKRDIIEEYHQRRHLLVHRLGKTDQFYRDRYNYTEPTITVEKYYLEHCFEDFKEFAHEIHNQIKIKLTNNFYIKKSKQKSEAKCKIDLDLSSKKMNIFDSNYEFLSGDSITRFGNLFEQKIKNNDNSESIFISGTKIEMLAYVNILNAEIKRGKIKATVETKFSQKNSEKPRNELTTYLLDKIKSRLPEQPWTKNQHKRTAKELGLSNKTVSRAIEKLIEDGILKKQYNGEIIE